MRFISDPRPTGTGRAAAASAATRTVRFMTTGPGERSLGRRLAGAVAQFWGGGAGPTHNAVDSCLMIVGLDPSDYVDTKEGKVRTAFARADDETARELAQELIDLLRTEGVFEYQTDETSRRIRTTQKAFAAAGATLSDDGHLSWGTGQPSPSAGATGALAPAVTTPAATLQVASTAPTTGQETTGPSLGSMLEVLRRVPTASRPLVGPRRKGRSSVPITDEYDAQDFVHQALRLLYDDTRPEEVTPSYAGSSSRCDFFVKAESTVVEVKVTQVGRAERPIRDEIIIDKASYRRDQRARHLVVVVYDLVGNIRNVAGFEDDLSDHVEGFRTTVLVVRWPTFS